MKMQKMCSSIVIVKRQTFLECVAVSIATTEKELWDKKI
jgi:hypothetical protein